MININIDGCQLFLGWCGSQNEYYKILSAQSTYTWEFLESLEDYDIYVCKVSGRKAIKLKRMSLMLDLESCDYFNRYELIKDNIDQYTIKDILS